MSGQDNKYSDTFGKFDSVNEVKNVDARSWQPISAGAVRENRNETSQQTSYNNQKASPKSTQKASSASAKKPLQNKSASPKKSPPKAEGKKAQSRVPKGKDMRDDGRNKDKQRQYNESLIRSGEDYEKQKQQGISHDEISKVRKENKRKRVKWKNVLIALSPVVFAIFCIVFFCYNRGAPIQNINVNRLGAIYSEQEIIEASGIEKGDSLFSLNEREVRENITKKLPYIKDVEITTDFPDTVFLKIISTADKFVITGSDTWLTLDKDGKVLTSGKVKIRETMYRIDGFTQQLFSPGEEYVPSGDNVKRYKLMQELVKAVEEEGTVKIATISFKDTDNVYMIYDERIAIYFGSCDNIEKRVKNACEILRDNIDVKGQGYIDMRFENNGYFKAGSMKIQQTPVVSSSAVSESVPVMGENEQVQ